MAGTEEKAMTADELLFFDSKPGLVPIYDALRTALAERYPEVRIKVAKTQISFCNRHLFAMASLPRRKGESHLLVSFGLGRRESSGRVMQAVEPYPGRWTHHVPVHSPAEVDPELLAWLEEAYQFANNK